MDSQFILDIRFTGHKLMRAALLKNEEQMDAVDFSFDSDLDTLLIENVDKILKRNRITTSSLSEVKVGGDVDPNSSAYKIAQTFAVALKSFKNQPH